MGEMLQLEEAQTRALALIPDLPIMEIPVDQAAGRYLASDLFARRTQPPADLSAMDGYAISGEGPWEMVGESRAGMPFAGTLASGKCVRISTGAHMPSGSDRVLIQENASVSAEVITCETDLPGPGRHVRKQGFDFNEGELILEKGTLVGPAQLALALGAGYSTVPVRRSLTAVVIDSGDELCADAETCGHDQIPASNGAMIASLLRAQGCDVRRIGPVADDANELATALREAEGADLLVTTGGASVGDHDLIQPALNTWGADLDFWKVAIKPGKPLMVAIREKQVIFGLPGNPVSSFVTAFLFVLPFVRAAHGARDATPRVVKLPTGMDLPEVGSRREFLRAYWDGQKVSLSDSQDSSALRALANSNCLIDRPANASSVSAGELLPCFLLPVL